MTELLRSTLISKRSPKERLGQQIGSMNTKGISAHLCAAHAQYSAWEGLPVPHDHDATIACSARSRVELRLVHDRTCGTFSVRSLRQWRLVRGSLPSFSPWRLLRVVKLHSVSLPPNYNRRPDIRSIALQVANAL